MKRTQLVLSVLCALALVGCSSGKKKLELGGSCTLNSDCAEGLQCKFGACHKACVKSVDCATGERCIQVDGIAVCQMVKEQACGANYVCAAGLVCMKADNTCRNDCSPTKDCLGGQVCTAGFCLEKNESVAGLDGGATGAEAGVGGADTGAPVGADAGAAGNPDVALVTDAPVPTVDAPAVATDAPVDAPVGGADAKAGPDAFVFSKLDGAPSSTCNPACTAGQECVAGTCQQCGKSAGQPCCAGTCNANLTCNASNKCACGSQDESCCDGKTCTSGLACVGGTCTCGEYGATCCTGKTCNHGVCAGTACTCLKACEPSWHQKADGTIGRTENQNFKLLAADGSVFADPAATFTGETYSDSEWQVCVVPADGSVWCAGTNEGGALGGGDTSLTSSNKLVRVLTGVAGAPLTGIKKVSNYRGNTGPGATACALATDGGVWCWGKGESGQLGTGFKAGSSFAVPVVNAPGGTPFTDAMDVSVGLQSACALKKDGTVWCWGANNSGQLGIGETSTINSPIPKAVVGLVGHPIRSIAVDGYAVCATEDGGYVWCWGDRSYVGPDYTGASNPTPVRVVMSKGGAALSDVDRVVHAGRALKKDGTLWDWTDSAPQPVTRAGVAVASPYFVGRGCFITADGKMYTSLSAAIAVACP